MHTLVRSTVIAALLAGATPAGMAAEESASDGPDAATRKAAAEFVEQRYKGQMHERLRKGMTRTLLQSMPKLRRHQSAVKKFVNQNTDQGELASHLEKLYAKRFTAEELKRLTEFYKTEVGQKTLTVVPEIESQAMRWSMRRLQKNSGALKKLVRESQRQQSGGQMGQSGGTSKQSGSQSGQQGGQSEGQGQSQGQGQ